MAGRKTRQLNRTSSSQLLSLPPEVRRMIWKATIATNRILLSITTNYPYGHSYQPFGPDCPPRSVCLPRLEGGCDEGHQLRPLRTRIKRVNKAIGPLSWLRTNRQIHNEATPLLKTHMNLHICRSLDSQMLSAFVFNPPLGSLDSSSIRSLSLCIKVLVESDLRDGFAFTRDAASRWTAMQAHPHDCGCINCSPFGDKTDNLPGLRHLKLRVYFECRNRQGNDRPFLGTFCNRRRYGMLWRPKDPRPLEWKGVDGGVEAFVGDYVRKKPFKMFMGGKLETVDIGYCTQRIQHGWGNNAPRHKDRCWCIGRVIDEESLLRSRLAEEMRLHLLG